MLISKISTPYNNIYSHPNEVYNTVTSSFESANTSSLHKGT